jgi:hypothetical protein
VFKVLKKKQKQNCNDFAAAFHRHYLVALENITLWYKTNLSHQHDKRKKHPKLHVLGEYTGDFKAVVHTRSIQQMIPAAAVQQGRYSGHCPIIYAYSIAKALCHFLRLYKKFGSVICEQDQLYH